MYKASAGVTLPTSIIGSLPRPAWYNAVLGSKSFLEAMVVSRYREQYEDAVSRFLRAQEIAGLVICTDGDAHYDEEVGGLSWQSYPLTDMSRTKAATPYNGSNPASRVITLRRAARSNSLRNLTKVVSKLVGRQTERAVDRPGGEGGGSLGLARNGVSPSRCSAAAQQPRCRSRRGRSRQCRSNIESPSTLAFAPGFARA